MIYGTKLLETEMELFTAALTQTQVYVWTMDSYGVYFQVDSGFIQQYSPDYVKLRSLNHLAKPLVYPREQCEFSISSL